MKSSGLAEPLNSWLTSYLSNRSQIVIIGETPHQPSPTTCGALQISVLGPLLFLLYLNEIIQAICRATPSSLADGIKIVHSFGLIFLHQTMASFVEDLKAKDEWCGNNAMNFYATNCVVFVTFTQVGSL